MSDRYAPKPRQRFVEDMWIKGLQPKTQTIYLQAMRDFIRFRGHAPDRAIPEEFQAFQLDMKRRGVGARIRPRSASRPDQGLRAGGGYAQGLEFDNYCILVYFGNLRIGRKARHGKDNKHFSRRPLHWLHRSAGQIWSVWFRKRSC